MLFKGDRMNNYILQLAELLSMGHSTVRKELETCVADTEKYCKEHQQEYETLGCLGGVIAEEDYGCIQWLILAECLVRYNIAAMLDWKCELENFAYFVKGLAGKRKYKLTFRTAWFDEEESIEEWCTVLNVKWQSAGVYFAQLDMCSDSYTLLPILSDQYELARRLAKELGQRIILPDVENPEDSSEVLYNFLQRHPYTLSAHRSPAPASCEKCFADGSIVYPVIPCNCEGGKQYQIVINTQKLTPRQIVVASKHMRMGAMEMRQRLTLGKDVYVKAYLQDTLLAINELEKERIAYEVLPEAPQYLHFQECQKRHVHSERYDYKYFLLDREREKEWSGKD